MKLYKELDEGYELELSNENEIEQWELRLMNNDEIVEIASAVFIETEYFSYIYKIEEDEIVLPIKNEWTKKLKEMNILGKCLWIDSAYSYICYKVNLEQFNH